MSSQESVWPLLSAAGMSVPEITEWVAAGHGLIPGRRLALMALAGFTPDDTLFAPGVFDLPDDRLRILAALNGHHIPEPGGGEPPDPAAGATVRGQR